MIDLETYKRSRFYYEYRPGSTTSHEAIAANSDAFWSDANLADPRRAAADADVQAYRVRLEASRAHYAKRAAEKRKRRRAQVAVQPRAVEKLVLPEEPVLPKPIPTIGEAFKDYRAQRRAAGNTGGNESTYFEMTVSDLQELPISMLTTSYVEKLRQAWATVPDRYRRIASPATLERRLAFLERLLRSADMAPHGVLADGSNRFARRSERWGLAATMRQG